MLDIWGAEAQIFTGYFYDDCEMDNSLFFFLLEENKLKILYYKKNIK